MPFVAGGSCAVGNVTPHFVTGRATVVAWSARSVTWSRGVRVCYTSFVVDGDESRSCRSAVYAHWLV